MEKKKFRDEIAEEFVKALEDDPLTFVKGWSNTKTGRPINLATGASYRGINRLNLKIVENKYGFGDNRWMTFKQIKDSKKYHLKQGSKGVKVEYYIPYDFKEKKWISWDYYNDLDPNHLLKQKIYTVFNGSQIEGLEKVVKIKENCIDENTVVEKISESLGVPIKENYNSDSAFYNIVADEIAIPLKGQFNTQEDYIAVCLHELGHSTGHETRLNRKIENKFGSQAYAFEELVAEMTSAFMGEYVAEPMNDYILANHKAYIQSWAEVIKKDKNFLFKAVKEADRATDYMVEKAHLVELFKAEEVQDEEELEM